MCEKGKWKLVAAMVAAASAAGAGYFMIQRRSPVRSAPLTRFERSNLSKGILSVIGEEARDSRSIALESRQIILEYRPVVLESRWVIEESRPVVQESRRVVEASRPIVEASRQVVQEPGPIIEEPGPIVEEPRQVVEETNSDILSRSGSNVEETNTGEETVVSGPSLSTPAEVDNGSAYPFMTEGSRIGFNVVIQEKSWYLVGVLRNLKGRKHDWSNCEVLKIVENKTDKLLLLKNGCYVHLDTNPCSFSASPKEPINTENSNGNGSSSKFKSKSESKTKSK